jgi:hypothetical protein
MINLLSLDSSITQEIITFDDLPSAIENALPMPHKYKGLVWAGCSYLHELYTVKKWPKGGYATSFMPCGSLQAGYFHELATINTDLPDETFTLVSLIASAAWNDDLMLNITAYRRSVVVNNHNIVLFFGRPRRILLDWKNIDKVTLKPSGGIARPGTGQAAGCQVVLTQLTIDKLGITNNNI